MTRTEAEQRYEATYRVYLAAKQAVYKAQSDIYETRGITLPYVGPMKNKVRHADQRIAAIEWAVVKEGGWQPDAHSDADIPIQTEHCTHSRTPTPRNTVGSCR